MRLGLTLVGIACVCLLGLISVIGGPQALAHFLPSPGSAIIGALVFCSCLTGMMVAHIYVGFERAQATAARLHEANAELEVRVAERTRSLSEKVVELEHARAAAVEANSAKSRFLATMSHELRTPLNAILGFSEIIQTQMFGPAGDARYVDYARHIRDSGAHLLSLVRDVLDLSKIEAGKMELHCEDVTVDVLVDDARQISGADHGHVLTVLVQEDLPALNVDRRAVAQMLINLLSNATKFTARGGAIAVTAMTRNDGGITVTVRDSGVGIAREDIPKALSAYSQVSNGEVKRRDGTGLGLPIVNALMTLHGGTLVLDSEVGVGTSVALHFPAARTAGNSGAIAA
jgi:signal transduction histidine kinase